MNVALIGAGNNASGHAKSLAQIEGIQIVGVADPIEEKASALAGEVGANSFTDHKKMLDSVKPDAVWISSPCWLHPDHTVDCAGAGAHVMCEKPMALSMTDCDRMIAAARDNGVKLAIGQSTRYAPALLEVKRIFESGQCGDLVTSWSIRMSYHKPQPHAPWRMDGEKSGGIVFEWEVHEIDFIRSLGGKVSDVYARTAYSRDDAPNFLDHFSAILTFESGGYGNLEASQSCTLGPGGRGFVGTKGSAQTSGRDTVQVKINEMDEVQIVQVPPDPHAERGFGRQTQNVDFIRAIREDDVSPIPGEDGRANIEIGLAIIESGKTGDVVRLPLSS